MSAVIDNVHDLDKALKTREKALVLFYASWCPFSRMFLPVFEKRAERAAQECLRVMIDRDDALSERYGIEVVPTVLFFEKGEVSRRLDGVSGAGLSGKELDDMLVACRLKQA